MSRRSEPSILRRSTPVNAIHRCAILRRRLPRITEDRRRWTAQSAGATTGNWRLGI
jgi:hypothetical protein